MLQSGEKEEYPDFVKDFRNIIIWVGRVVFFGEEGGSTFRHLQRLLPMLERAEKVKIRLNWQWKNETKGEARFLEMVQEGLNEMPRLQQYLVVDGKSSLVCDRG